MKKNLSVMAMFVCIAAMSVFISCKDEKSNAELIHGKWNVDKIFVNGTETTGPMVTN